MTSIVRRFLLVALLAAPCASRAADPWAWTPADTMTEAGYLTLHMVDWGQTRHIAARPTLYDEVNPLLGRHPSKRSVDQYMAASAVLHVVVARALPAPYRRWWQAVTIGAKAGLVGMNMAAGIAVEW